MSTENFPLFPHFVVLNIDRSCKFGSCRYQVNESISLTLLYVNIIQKHVLTDTCTKSLIFTVYIGCTAQNCWEHLSWFALWVRPLLIVYIIFTCSAPLLITLFKWRVQEITDTHIYLRFSCQTLLLETIMLHALPYWPVSCLMHLPGFLIMFLL